MRLYPKKLRNIESLEREKKKLLKQKQELDKEEFLSLDGILGKKSARGEDTYAGGQGSLLDLLPMGGDIVNMVVKIAESVFAEKGDTRADKTEAPHKKKSHKSPFRVIAREIIGGYLKWKAIELSFKGVRHIIKSRGNKKEEGQK